MLLRPARRALTVREPPPWSSAGATIIARSAVLPRGDRQEPRTIALIGGRASSDGRFLFGVEPALEARALALARLAEPACYFVSCVFSFSAPVTDFRAGVMGRHGDPASSV
jgi:hypothetical protein